MSQRMNISIAIMLVVAAGLQAAVVYNEWNGAAGTTDWNTAGNWKLGYVPFIFDGTNQIKAGFKVNASVTVWPIITSSTIPAAQADQITLGGTSGGFLRIESGTLNIGEFITMGANVGENGTFYINGGTINTGVGYTNAHFFVGQKGTGTLYMNDGIVNLPSTGNLRIADQLGSSGTVYLNGGVINANDLLMPFAAAGSLNFGRGQLVLNGNQLTDIASFIDAGKIVTSLEGYSVQASFDSTANKTTVMAVIPEPATLCLLGVGLLGCFGRKR
ncbi:MAG: PEP-CTERM sorting domain-containing protein [Planctomycetaceae bacterium]|nr:PEP-CTERM sorting domain-containing protein [Planctomycetaceae bacterium]